ncbi:MAG: chemotaxis protein CheA [Syntrophales bacterium]|nr:chemotaxis protein CheA [Syntrophales bacterium]
MELKNLLSLINGLVADFLCLNGREIDIPSSGRFLNVLEEMSKIAREMRYSTLNRVSELLIHLLERLILEEVKEKQRGFEVFEKGVSLLQEIGQVLERGEDFADEERIRTYVNSVKELTGGIAEVEEPSHCDRAFDEGGSEVRTEPLHSYIHQDTTLLSDFITEALEYIGNIEISILDLEQNPHDKDCINAIFRPFHSIKGVAGFLGLANIRDLAHSLENLLDKARNDELTITPSVIDVVLDGTDLLKGLILKLRDEMSGKAFSGGEDVGDFQEIMERIRSVENGMVEPAGAKRLGEILLEEGVIDQEKLDVGLKKQSVSPGKKIGEVLIEEKLVTPKQVSRALRKQAEYSEDMSTIRVDTRKLDDVIDLVGELVITKTMLEQDLRHLLTTDRNIIRDMGQLNRITSGLQRMTTGLRMVPIRQSFQRMARLIRDLARESGKRVTVELEGEDTEIDRHMVEEIYNPLVHLVRNAVDHGLEDPEERLTKGKLPEGHVKLKAYHRGGNIVIEISDDGRGLDRERILNKALSKNLISGTEHLTDQEVYRLIFLPGFSTADQVTEISGRGVGMDVVKQSVEKLRGKIDIETSPDEGTTFIISLPLTMAIIDGIIVRVGEERYILPTVSIRQALRPQRESCSVVVGRGEMVNVLGRLMPLVRLGSLFGVKGKALHPWESIVVVMESDGHVKAVMVDEIVGKAEVVIKGLGDSLKNVKGVAGGAILGDGQVGLIIDAAGLFALSESVKTN